MTGFAEDNASCAAPMTKAEFLRWVQRQERRHEFVAGRAVMHAGSTKRHNWLAQNSAFMLRQRLVSDDWCIGFADVAVSIRDDIRYPDVLLEKREGDGRDLVCEAPVLIAEILSPSSTGADLTIKLAEYTSLPSLQAYIVASQDEPIVWLWQRDAASRAFPAKPQEIAGREAAITVAGLGLSLPMAELYRGIKTSSYIRAARRHLPVCLIVNAPRKSPGLKPVA